VGRRGQLLQTLDGELVPPTQIEEVVVELTGVTEAVALQRSDERVLTVCVTSRVPTDREQILRGTREAIEGRFGGRLVLDRVVVLADLPRTPATNKINRRLLLEALDTQTAPILEDFADLRAVEP
jgi:acyl-coenzyme A synthetase/AMP-(fatty) acid ligase